MIESYLKHLDLDVPVISCSGAVLREPFSDQVFLSEALPMEQSLRFIDICREIEIKEAELLYKFLIITENNEDAVSEAIERFLLA